MAIEGKKRGRKPKRSRSSTPTPLPTTSYHHSSSTKSSSPSPSPSPSLTSSSSASAPPPHPHQFQQRAAKRRGTTTTNNNTTKAAAASGPITSTIPLPLILTSEKKRGLYECDYCHTDISQVPRICCAICPDFDFCLECFATNDPSRRLGGLGVLGGLGGAGAGAGVLEASSGGGGLSSAGTAGAVVGESILEESTPSNHTLEPIGGGIITPTTGTLTTPDANNPNNNNELEGGGLGSTSHKNNLVLHHDDTHSYRVADSTRYFMFPSLRGVLLASQRRRQLQIDRERMSGVDDDGGGGGGTTTADTSNDDGGGVSGGGDTKGDIPNENDNDTNEDTTSKKRQQPTEGAVQSNEDTDYNTTDTQPRRRESKFPFRVITNATQTAGTSTRIEDEGDSNSTKKINLEAEEKEEKKEHKIPLGVEDAKDSSSDVIADRSSSDGSSTKKDDALTSSSSSDKGSSDAAIATTPLTKAVDSSENITTTDTNDDHTTKDLDKTAEMDVDDVVDTTTNTDSNKTSSTKDSNNNIATAEDDTALLQNNDKSETKEDAGKSTVSPELPSDEGNDNDAQQTKDDPPLSPQSGSKDAIDSVEDTNIDKSEQDGEKLKDVDLKRGGSDEDDTESLDTKPKLDCTTESMDVDTEMPIASKTDRGDGVGGSGGNELKDLDDTADKEVVAPVSKSDFVEGVNNGSKINAEEDDDDNADDDNADGDKVMSISGNNENEVNSGNDSKTADNTNETQNDVSVAVSGKETMEVEEDDLALVDDPRSMWTVEEDLRMLDAISTCGLGNWADISEIVGNGKSGKRCMERYIDDYLGRYGHILPKYTMVEVKEEKEEKGSKKTSQKGNETDLGDGKKLSRKRKWADCSTNDNKICFTSNTNRNYTLVPSSSLAGYDDVWPNAYIPPLPGLKYGDDVGRDLSFRAEHEFVKITSNITSKNKLEKIRKEWATNRLHKVGGPKALPPRVDDFLEMPGSGLGGFMPRRGDFELEWDNDAEAILAEMDFSPDDHPEDRALKIQVVEIYNSKLDEREKRKKFLVDHKLLDYRKRQVEDQMRPPDERDLVNRMRLFARFHTPEEHEKFIKDLLKAKRLRKDIAKLQMCRRMGITSLAEAERFEIDSNRREAHRIACLQKEMEEERAELAVAKAAAANEADGIGCSLTGGGSGSLWKQYSKSDRKSRKSRSLGGSIADGSELGDEHDEGSDESMIKNVTKDADNKLDEAEKMTASTCNGSDAPHAEIKEELKYTFNVRNCPGCELLSVKEVALCQRLELLPKHYIEAKKALIQESFTHGILDNASVEQDRRSIVKIDVEKRDNVIDFILQSGWISSKPKYDEICCL